MIQGSGTEIKTYSPSPETRIETKQVESLPTVQEVWNALLGRHSEIIANTFVYYKKTPHGVSVRRFSEKQFPHYTFLHPNDTVHAQQNDLVAISSVVGIESDLDDPNTRWQGVFNGFLGDYDEMNIIPRSFIFVDIEYPNTHATKQLLLDVLPSLSEDWFLLDSGGSYHLIIDRLVELHDLPKYWGLLVNTFAVQPNISIPGNMVGIGNQLVDYANNPAQLRRLAEDLLRDFGHVDDPISSGKKVFLIDIRHLAHSIIEYVDYLEGERNVNGFCYLRINRPLKYKSQPLLVAKKDADNITIFESENYPFDSGQIELPFLA